MIIERLFDRVGGASGPYHGVTYSLTAANSVSLLQTPDLWGHRPDNNDYWSGGKTPAQTLLTEMTSLIASAEVYVDISTMMRLPDGRFLEAIREGLKKLAAAKRFVVVRILFGSPISTDRASLKDWIKALDPPPELPVYVAAMHSGALSWNHAKIIAVDGKRALCGGHNMWDSSYCSFGPVHDLAVVMTGDAARTAVSFLNRQWNTVSAGGPSGVLSHLYWTEFTYGGKFGQQGLPLIGVAAPAPVAIGNVLALGRLGQGIVPTDSSSDASRTARNAAINMATRSIKIVQQDLGLGLWPTTQFDEEFMAALAGAIARGVKTEIVLNNVGAADGAGFFYTTWSGVNTPAARIKDDVRKLTGQSGAELNRLLTDTVSIAPFRFCDRNTSDPNSTDYQWRKNTTHAPGVEPASHSKTYCIDDTAIYVGSDNIYPILLSGNALQEFGYIIEDTNFTNTYLTKYWSEIWKYSSQWKLSWDAVAYEEQ